MSRIGAALVDVGGTLWPDRWPATPTDDAHRIGGLRILLPELSPDGATRLHAALLEAGAALEGQIEQNLDQFVGATLAHFGLPATPSKKTAVLDAMCIPARHRVSLFPDARELLATIKHEGLRCVVFSNTVWRRARSYWRDFEAFDVAHLVDAVVASVDLGVRKPHRAMFEASADAGGISLDRCVVIGNSERLDVEPARALGLRVLRVAIEEPVPHTSQADRTASSLHEAAEVLQTWCRGREQQES